MCTDGESTCKSGATPAKVADSAHHGEGGRALSPPSVGHWSQKLLKVWLLLTVSLLSNHYLRSSVSPDEEMWATFPPRSRCSKALFKYAVPGWDTAAEGFPFLSFDPLLPKPISASSRVRTWGLLDIDDLFFFP